MKKNREKLHEITRQKAKKLIGQKFGNLTCMDLVGQDKDSRYLYLWKCKCGKTMVAPSNNIKYGLVKGCGCKTRENIKNPMKNNKLNVLGVYKTYKRKNGEYSYKAYIMIDKKSYSKTFKTLEKAIEYRKKLEGMRK